MNIKIIFYFLFFIAITSCNYRLIVRRDKVIYCKTGFIIFTNDNDYFIPVEINRMDNYMEFIKNNEFKNVGFLLSNFDRNKRFQFIQLYCDTMNYTKIPPKNISNVIFIAPVKIVYYYNIEGNKKFNKEAKITYNYLIQPNDIKINIKYNLQTNYIINIIPFYTLSKIFYLENNYLETDNKIKK